MNKKPLIEKGWLSVLVYLIVALVLTIPFGFVLLKKVVVVSTIKTQENVADILQLLLYYLLSNIGLVIAVVLCTLFIDKRTINSLGFSLTNFLNEALAGFFVAVLILCVGTLVLVNFEYLSFSGYTILHENLLIQALLFLIVALVEEVVFRGYILNNLLRSFNKWIALILSAIVFTLFHASNSGINFIAVSSLLIGGVLLGLNYIYTKHLWFAIFLHFAWNFFQGPILGYEVSGVNTTSLLQQTLVGPAIFTGGNFGFEGSIICIVVEILAIAFLWRYYDKRVSNKK